LDEPPGTSLINILADKSLLYLIFIAGFLSFSAWISAVEAAFFSLNKDDIDRLKNSANAGEKTAADVIANPRLLLGVLTTCKYAMLLAAAVLTVTFLLAVPAHTRMDISMIIGVLLLTVFFAVAAVILPKIYGTTHAITVSSSNSKLCSRLITLLKPVLWPLLKASVKVEKKLEAKTEQKSVEQLTQALQLATVDNEPVEGEKEILEGIVNFGTLTVKQVMKPRSEISYTDISLNFHELLEFVKRSGYSRVPVCRGSLDKIEGFLYIKDLLPFLEESGNFLWQRLLRPGYFVPEEKKIDFLLKDFQEKRVHMALVINSGGSTIGLITLEDIIEEIIGEINDEFDEVGVLYHRINDRSFIFDGKISVHEFCKVLQVDPAIFHPVKGINESLGGILLEVSGKLPAVGDEIAIDFFTFVVESVDNKRIKKIKVHINEQKEQQQ
jgi:putative hemolysin